MIDEITKQAPLEASPLTGQVEISQEIIQGLQKTIKDIASLTNFLYKNLSKNITKLMETILTGSIILGASDIHF